MVVYLYFLLQVWVSGLCLENMVQQASQTVCVAVAIFQPFQESIQRREPNRAYLHTEKHHKVQSVSFNTTEALRSFTLQGVLLDTIMM